VYWQAVLLLLTLSHTKLLEENKKAGLLATTEDVKRTIASKDTAVVDVRSSEEWAEKPLKWQ